MKVNVNEIQNHVYQKICLEFAEFAEKKLKDLDSIFQWLATVDLEDVITPNQIQVHQHYADYCKTNELEPWTFKGFCRFMKRCGFDTQIIGKGTNRKVYFRY